MPGCCKFWQPLASKIMKYKETGQKMAKQDHVRAKVEETLASLDHMEQLQAGPAFISRLQARLAAGAGQPAQSRRLFRLPQVYAPVLRPVLLALLILVNLLTVVFVARTSAAQGKAEKTSILTVAKDYSLDQNLDELYFAGKEMGK
jgi:hypothetical protein